MLSMIKSWLVPSVYIHFFPAWCTCSQVAWEYVWVERLLRDHRRTYLRWTPSSTLSSQSWRAAPSFPDPWSTSCGRNRRQQSPCAPATQPIKLFAAVYQNLTLHSLWNFVSIEPHPPSSCWEFFVATEYQASWSTIKPISFSRSSLLCLLYIFPPCAALNSESHCA